MTKRCPNCGNSEIACVGPRGLQCALCGTAYADRPRSLPRLVTMVTTVVVMALIGALSGLLIDKASVRVAIIVAVMIPVGLALSRRYRVQKL